MSGGLKAIEKMAGLTRRGNEEGDGAQAAAWWAQYAHQGNAASLERLMRYNARDTLSLMSLTAHLWRRSMDGFPDLLTIPSRPACATGVSVDL